MNVNETMRKLAEYSRMKEEIETEIESLKDVLKAHMVTNGVDVLLGNEHRATYKDVSSSRLDATALKKEMPQIAKMYTLQTVTKRFCFA